MFSPRKIGEDYLEMLLWHISKSIVIVEEQTELEPESHMCYRENPLPHVP
jgi:hypothetical protein